MFKQLMKKCRMTKNSHGWLTYFVTWSSGWWPSFFFFLCRALIAHMNVNMETLIRIWMLQYQFQSQKGPRLKIRNKAIFLLSRDSTLCNTIPTNIHVWWLVSCMQYLVLHGMIGHFLLNLWKMSYSHGETFRTTYRIRWKFQDWRREGGIVNVCIAV